MGEDLLSTSRSLPEVKKGPRSRILIVEDSKTDVYLIREALSGQEIDADVHVVYDGEAATRFIDEADADEDAAAADIVLLDLNLPRKSGDEVLRHLRASSRCRNATVVIVSSSDAPRDRAAVTEFGVAAYFRKPSDYAGFMTLGPLVKSLLG